LDLVAKEISDGEVAFEKLCKKGLALDWADVATGFFIAMVIC
jgi:hypothetical protein